MKKDNILACPLCKAELTKKDNSLFCKGERKHCFDIAKSGYVSLANTPGTSGDDRDMVRARTAFLDKGYYRPFANALCELTKGLDTVIDAGCGEGYYTNLMAEDGADVYGFDLSKYACERGAKRAKAMGTSAFFGVAGVFSLPVSDSSADAVVSLFAPIAEKEFHRVLKKDGILIVGAAGRRHLYELKAAVYDEPYENEGRRDLPLGFEQADLRNVNYVFDCDGSDLMSLFLMTPYAFKTSKSDAAKLNALTHLEITADFDIFVYKKK